MIEQEIRDRLKAALDGRVAAVEGAVALAMVKGRPLSLPAVYVMGGTENAEDNPYGMGAFRQRVDAGIVVVIVTDDVSDTRGEAAGDAIEILKSEIRAALLGWQPTSSDEPVALVSGEFIAARDNVVWWQETYATAYYLRGSP